MSAMEISFTDGGNGATPTKQFADEAWRRWMRLSPDYWRETLGVTVGKVWRDARDRTAADCFAWGVNGVYGEASPEAGMVAVVEVAGDVAGWAEPVAESVVWRVKGAPDKSGLRMLEGWVKRGVIGHYGLAGFAATEIQAWVALAEEVAEEVWGRKKRAGLRCVVVQANVVEMEAFVAPLVVEVRHGESEVISIAEFAARRGWRVLVEGALEWQVPGIGRIEWLETLPDDTDVVMAVGLLEAVVEAEDGLDLALGGWPMVEGAPLWRAGALVGSGMPLWYGRESLEVWVREIWPAMRVAVQGMVQEASHKTAWQGYVAAVEGLLEGGGAAILAILAERRVAEAVMAALRERMTAAERVRWEGVPDSALAVAALASVPAVCGVLVSGQFTGREAWVRAIQARPDVADVGRLLG